MRSLPTGPVEDSSSALFPDGRRGPYPGRTTPVGGLRMAQAFTHEPVLADAVVRYLQPVPAGIVVDGTVGGAGHAAALLSSRSDLSLLGLDRDPAAVAEASARLARFAERSRVTLARFSTMEAALSDALRDGALLGQTEVVGVLLDLGVSSHQLEEPTRGFSYRTDGPLDMRMGTSEGPTAAEYLADVDEVHFARLLAQNGEGRFARVIARNVLEARPTTTAELAAAVERSVPAAARRRGHVASRVFQALRIAVNDELGELQRALAAAQSLLVPGGRLVVIAYHSGEDALVKATLRDAATGGCACPPGLPCGCGAVPTMRLVTRGAEKASAEEVARNPRARSARLRVAEQLVVP